VCVGSFFIWRKRRGLVARGRYGDGYVVIAGTPDVARVGRSGRAALAEPRTKIDLATRERIARLAAADWSLRSIAGEVGVSHESVRTVLRELAVTD